jgi:aryl-alcohol dehydrogenase-like predicted oxidoreductase
MHYKLLGPTGLRVSELCLGAMTFGENWGWGASIEECRKLFNAYLDQGGNFIDTANNYTNGSSETIVGELTKGVRDKVVIATKYTLNTDPEKNINGTGCGTKLATSKDRLYRPLLGACLGQSNAY